MSVYVFEARVEVSSRRRGFVPRGTLIEVYAVNDDEAIAAMLGLGFTRGELCAFYGEERP